MKNVLFLLFITLISCQKNTLTIPSDVLLKDASDSFFQSNTTHNIQKSKGELNYTNEYSRLPNTEFSKFYLKKHPETYAPYFNITLNLSLNHKITFEGVEIFEDELISYVKEFVEFAAEGRPSMIHLNFDENISFLEYRNFITFIEVIQSDVIKINKTVFIYNIKSLPDCDCSL